MSRAAGRLSPSPKELDAWLVDWTAASSRISIISCSVSGSSFFPFFFALSHPAVFQGVTVPRDPPLPRLRDIGEREGALPTLPAPSTTPSPAFLRL
jgi:hypothetical protein